MKKYYNLFDIYSNRSRINLVIGFVAVIIGVGSIYYTDMVVEQLRKREQRLIDLYAKAIEYASNEVSSDNLAFLHQEIIVANHTIPVILTNENNNIISHRNIDIPKQISKNDSIKILEGELIDMQKQHPGIKITFKDTDGTIFGFNYVYYKDSYILTQLKFYPYIQISIIMVFAILAYFTFSYSKRAEQNRVWVGLAKETAHQLGTPLSSLIAWVEYLKNKKDSLSEEKVISELDKDTKRLEMVTSRFSSIGSTPSLSRENIIEVIKNAVQYLQNRISKKISIKINSKKEEFLADINKPLFDWVIENLVKNAVDAMASAGQIDIDISETKDQIFIDFTDSGKGISKSHFKKIFQPGYTSKPRGWGLGLTLVKRIIENYHKGKIFVKKSSLGEGSTIRIVLNQ